MTICYLVLAHQGPAHLARLVDAVQTPSADVLIHLDRKTDMVAFAGLARPGVRFVAERHAVYWGDYSQVEAILALMREALASKRGYTRQVLLSGSDYPLRSSAHIERFFAERCDAEFINLVEMPCDKLGKPLSRIDKFWPRRSRPWSRIETKLRRAAVRFGLMSIERDHRPHLQQLKPFGGSTWWALTRGACEYVLDFMAREPAFVRFYANTVYPDELMMHTIIGNSPFRQAVRHNLTYTDWRKGGSNPATLEAMHVREFASVPKVMADDGYGQGELLFARKFSGETGELVAQLDAMREAKDQAGVQPAEALPGG